MSEVAEMLDISFGFAYTIFHEDLGYQKVCVRFVPRHMTETHKRQCTEAATLFLQNHEQNPGLLERIVTGNKTWVHHFDQGRKRESMEWTYPGLPQKKF